MSGWLFQHFFPIPEIPYTKHSKELAVQGSGSIKFLPNRLKSESAFKSIIAHSPGVGTARQGRAGRSPLLLKGQAQREQRKQSGKGGCVTVFPEITEGVPSDELSLVTHCPGTPQDTAQSSLKTH